MILNLDGFPPKTIKIGNIVEQKEGKIDSITLNRKDLTDLLALHPITMGHYLGHMKRALVYTKREETKGEDDAKER